MIDWMGVVTNAAWLFGLAVVLAALSYADWNAHHAGRRFCDVLGQPVFHMAVWSGLTLFCMGVGFSGGRWWERILWGVLAILAVVEVWQSARAVFHSTATTPHSVQQDPE